MEGQADLIPHLEDYVSSLIPFNDTWTNDSSLDSSESKISDLPNFMVRVTKERFEERRAEIRGSLAGGAVSDRVTGTPDDLSLPFTISWDTGLGRHLVATRDISEGTIIFSEPPLILSPKAGGEAVCLACFSALEKGQTCYCLGCGGPLCAQDCPGGSHSDKECEIVERLGLKHCPEEMKTTMFRQLNILLTPLKTWLLMQEYPRASATVWALQSNAEVRRDQPIGEFIQCQVLPLLQRRLGLDIDADTVHHICGVFDTNAFEVAKNEKSPVRGLFPLGSLMNHSCVANTQHWLIDGVCVVRTTRAIPKGDSITNPYTHALWGNKARSHHLSTTKLFVCTCPRCQDPTEFGSHTSSMICRTCKKGRLVPPSPVSAARSSLPEVSKEEYPSRAVGAQPQKVELLWECDSCGLQVPDATVDRMLLLAGALLKRVNVNDEKVLQKAIEGLCNILTPNHYILVEMKFALINNLVKTGIEELTEEQLKMLSSYTEQLLDLAQLIEPGLSRFRGVILLDNLQSEAEQLARFLKERRNSSGTNKEKQLYVQRLLSLSAECEFILTWDARYQEAEEVTAKLKQLYQELQ
ncbi:SET domain-containing protein SmydA-8-like isoform X2 [Oratosquilla oratoria]